MDNNNIFTCSSKRWTEKLISESEYSSILAKSAIINIKYPSGRKVRSRKVVKRSNYRMTTKYPSWKMGRMLECESKHELNAYRIFDADPRITQIFDQPFELSYELNGKSYKHFPDALTISNNSKTVWEIKQEPAKEDIEILLRSDILQSLFKSKGVVYRLAGGNDFSKEPMLSNSQLLLKHGRSNLDDCDLGKASKFFSRSQFAQWASFDIYGSVLRCREVLSRLVLEGKLVFDSSMAIVPSSKFYPSISWASEIKDQGGY